jgi:hypothetical protein
MSMVLHGVNYQLTKIDEVLDRINAITDNHRLIYQLESISEDKLSARVAILHVPPDNKINYQIAKLTNDIGWLAELVEEEVLVTLYHEDDKWQFTSKYRIGGEATDDGNAFDRIRIKITYALEPSDWANAHRMLPYKLKNGHSITEKHKNTVKKWNAGQGALQIADDLGWKNPQSVNNYISKIRKDFPNCVMTVQQRKDQKAAG